MADVAKRELNPYEKLTKTLNRIPNGFSTTKDGSHLKVLEWIFKPDEALIASKMKLTGELVKKMAKRLKIPEKKLAEKLEIMKGKGQIRRINSKKGTKYGLLPFVVGVYEDQLHRMDVEFAEIFEDYVQKSKAQIIFSSKPPIQKVVPVQRVIKTELVIHPHSKAEKMIRNAKSWEVRDCICRTQKELLGNSCNYPKNVCLSFSSRENAYKDNPPHSRVVTMEEALDILREAEEAGLIHSTMNIAEGHPYICNCCTCCCGILRALVEFDQPNAIVKSDYVLNIDRGLCNGCGKCLNRCQLNALKILDKKCVVNDRCIGCGVCAIVCPKNALSLIPRNRNLISKPPRNIIRWMLKRAWKRKVNITKLL
ncbi:MAG: 4Fe-4S ferredoxin [Asgard group archaeon]|nr:4Fe-4S ferredoxin [Asgard group archaeon]